MKNINSHSHYFILAVISLCYLLTGCRQDNPSPIMIESPTLHMETSNPTASRTQPHLVLTNTPAQDITPEAQTNFVTPTATPTADQTPTPTQTLIPLDEISIPTPFGTMIRPVDGMVMVYVPAGEFLMGSSQAQLDTAYFLCDREVVNSDCPPGRFADEAPQHSVALDAFWIDQTEVTVVQYQSCIDAGVCPPWDCYNPESEIGLPDYPIGCVRWLQADQYCRWVEARLPTEAEWEYAARGPESSVYPWGNTFDVRRTNFCDLNCYNRWRDPSYDDGYNSVAPVGTFPTGASWCGALDMAGNAAELVADWYNEDYYAVSPTLNPAGPETGSLVVFKGGASNHGASYLRSAWRATIPPDSYYGIVGFRCAKDE